MATEDLAAERDPAAPPREETRFSRPLRYVVRALVFLALIYEVWRDLCVA